MSELEAGGHVDQLRRREARLHLELLQAGVIRTLHNGMQSREERIDRLMVMFQSLQAAASQTAAPLSLPDGL